MTKQINEIGISFGLVQSVLKKDLSMLCGEFVRERAYMCVCARARSRAACMYSDGGPHGNQEGEYC